MPLVRAVSMRCAGGSQLLPDLPWLPSFAAVMPVIATTRFRKTLN